MKACIIILASFTIGVVRASCKNDWVQFQNSCYLFIDEHVPWTSAQMMCFLMRAKVLEVETQAENNFVVGQLHARPAVGTVWTGLQDFAREGTWVYTSTEEPAEYFHWQQGQPDNSQRHNEGGQDCAYIRNDGTWDDQFCENVYDNSIQPAVCCEAAPLDDSIVG